MSRLENKALSRRQALALLGAVGGATVAVACGSDTPTSPSSTSTSTSTATTTTTSAAGTTGACEVSPTETVGPYPSLSDLVRSDVREGRSGLPLSVILTVVNVNNSCSPLSGASIEIWQCDAQGHYSQYSQQGYDGRSETFLRGIQTTDSAGRASFMTIYPGWYQGRATHIHVEVTVAGRSVKVTQMAFPESVNAAVYATGVYASRGANPQSNAADMVFADSISSELAILTGDSTNGYTATFTVGVAA
jgi:protocatechuate 3,4-dioxygenase beta subunit